MAAAAYYYQAEFRDRVRSARGSSWSISRRCVWSRARFMSVCRNPICFDDLFSAGVVGLIQAIDNFDPRQNVKAQDLTRNFAFADRFSTAFAIPIGPRV